MEDSFIISTAGSAPILDASISLTALFRYFILSSALTFHGSMATFIFSAAMPLSALMVNIVRSRNVKIYLGKIIPLQVDFGFK